MITVTCFLWRSEDKASYSYSRDDVERLRSAVAGNLTLDHEVVCVTDDVSQFSGTGIRAVLLVTLPRCGRMFACQKLMVWHPDAGKMIGDRILMLDLDCAVVGNLDDIASRSEDVVLWRNPSRRPWRADLRRALYNSSIVLLSAGARPDVWERAIAGESIPYPGDQDWVSAVIGTECAYFDDNDGIYRLARADTPGSGVRETLPQNARIAFFPGDEGKPWLPHVRRACPWLDIYYPVRHEAVFDAT